MICLEICSLLGNHHCNKVLQLRTLNLSSIADGFPGHAMANHFCKFSDMFQKGGSWSIPPLTSLLHPPQHFAQNYDSCSLGCKWFFAVLQQAGIFLLILSKASPWRRKLKPVHFFCFLIPPHAEVRLGEFQASFIPNQSISLKCYSWKQFLVPWANH